MKNSQSSTSVVSTLAPVVTIDGPGGSGKGTLSLLVAQELGWHLLDSGALYRLLALLSQQRSVAIDDEPALAALAATLDVQFLGADFKDVAGSITTILLEGKPVTEAIRTEALGGKASEVAKLPAVREALLGRQRAFQQLPGLVADGRDMGTVVFPNAPLKVFLTASAEERAKRRYKQLKEKGESVTLAPLLKDIKKRDDRDMNRAVAPLQPAEDAVLLDSTNLSITEVFAQIVAEVKKRSIA